MKDLFRLFKGKKDTKAPLPEPEKKPLKFSLKENLNEIKETLGNTNDLLVRELQLKEANNIKVAVLGIDGLIDTLKAEQLILHVLSIDLALVSDNDQEDKQDIFDTIYNSRISMFDANTGDDFNALYTNLLSGHVLLLINGVVKFMMFDCKGWEMRTINEPTTEKSLRGPKDVFVETIRTNTATLRRRIKDPRLRFDAHVVGRVSQTDVFVTYIEGLTNPKYIEIANKRIENLDIDGLMNASELIKLIEDKHHSLFPRLIETERPDKLAASLMEGQIAIFIDGSPFAVLGPFYFTSAFQSIDDYYNPSFFATIKRIMRYTAYFAVVLIPGFYVALSTYHQEMIPTNLLIIVINQRSSNPFSTFVETLIILILFEILREASLRKPDIIGDSMTIVGSLIIGQTIVEAGLISYAAIIVGSLATIASFVLSGTKINTSARIFKIIFMSIAAWWGLYGMTLAFILLIMHLSSLTSFGEPYLAPIAPFNLKDQEDQLFKIPFSWMKYRPKIFKTQNQVRHNFSNGEGEEI